MLMLNVATACNPLFPLKIQIQPMLMLNPIIKYAGFGVQPHSNTTYVNVKHKLVRGLEEEI